MEIVRVARDELAAVDALVQQSGLPPLPPGQPASNVLVAREQGRICGAIALEVLGRRGLLHAVAVEPDRRGAGLGGDLVSSLFSRAHELGLRDVYLRTEEEARGFFARHGFAEVDPDALPPEIRAARAFREPLPDSAIAMCAPLETRW